MKEKNGNERTKRMKHAFLSFITSLHSSSSSLCFVQIQAERNVARDLNKEQSEEE